jgi:hypothetical protein
VKNRSFNLRQILTTQEIFSLPQGSFDFECFEYTSMLWNVRLAFGSAFQSFDIWSTFPETSSPIVPKAKLQSLISIFLEVWHLPEQPLRLLYELSVLTKSHNFSISFSTFKFLQNDSTRNSHSTHKPNDFLILIHQTFDALLKLIYCSNTLQKPFCSGYDEQMIEITPTWWCFCIFSQEFYSSSPHFFSQQPQKYIV